MKKNMAKVNYWDLTMFIDPNTVIPLPTDCGDSYDDNRRQGFTTPSGMAVLMMEHGSPFVNKEHAAFGSPKAMAVLHQINDKGVSIVIDGEGNLQAVIGDAFLEREEWDYND